LDELNLKDVRGHPISPSCEWFGALALGLTAAGIRAALRGGTTRSGRDGPAAAIRDPARLLVSLRAGP